MSAAVHDPSSVGTRIEKETTWVESASVRRIPGLVGVPETGAGPQGQAVRPGEKSRGREQEAPSSPEAGACLRDAALRQSA